jgi:hypothetical protein
MAKPPHHRAPDPMSGVVDRLLAQLPGLQSMPNNSASPPRAADHWNATVTAPRIIPASPTPAVGAWGRVLLALALGTMMAGWPYLHSCGLPLAGYLGAVGTVIVSGGWAAVASWRYRAALAHTVSLLILFYGIVLGAAELLPRTGYAAARASWQCEDTVLR